MRNVLKIPLDQYPGIIARCLNYAQQFDCFTYFNPCQYQYPFGTFDHQLFVGVHKKYTFHNLDDFAQLREVAQHTKDYIVCALSYDIKNQLEKLESNHHDYINAPLLFAYTPETIIRFETNEVIIESLSDGTAILNDILSLEDTGDYNHADDLVFEPAFTKAQYMGIIQNLRQHIEEGDMYEINFCMELLCRNAHFSPLQVYNRLIEKAPSPFSVFHRQHDIYVLSASPERFIKKVGRKLISQPIKGTARRDADPAIDAQLKEQLKTSEKERAENMMIVDLVRNDLSRSCEVGSVKVDEMFGIYSFPHWHQMISTVSGTLRHDTDGIDALKQAFPMGSMTGAPKIKVMELIERYEKSKRGLYSGSIGYITPHGDYDFNVIIRSLIYNASSKHCSYHVGGAITYDSDPEQEYAECMTKAKIITTLFSLQTEN